MSLSFPVKEQGVCRYCGCYDCNPCHVGPGDFDTCGWFDEDETICTNPECLVKAREEGTIR